MITSNRKLQAEIDKVLKKIEEGTEEFDDTLSKVQEAPNQSQKEKHENELKKEIKKLQRFREQIKIWQTSSEIKNKTALAAPREQIENRMKLFKDLEKETKTKPYSKEGLSRSSSSAKAFPQGSKSLSTSTSTSSTTTSAAANGAGAGGSGRGGTGARKGEGRGGSGRGGSSTGKGPGKGSGRGGSGRGGKRTPRVRETKGMQVCRWLDGCAEAIDAEIAALTQQAQAAAETTQKKRKGGQKARDTAKVIEVLRERHRENIGRVRAVVAERHINPSVVEVYLKDDLDKLLGSFVTRGGPGMTLSDNDNDDDDDEAGIDYQFLINSASDAIVEDEEVVDENEDGGAGAGDGDDDNEDEDYEDEDDDGEEYDVDDVDEEYDEDYDEDVDGEEEIADGDEDSGDSEDSNSASSSGSGSARNRSPVTEDAETGDNAASDKKGAGDEGTARASEATSKPEENSSVASNTTNNHNHHHNNNNNNEDDDDFQMITTTNTQSQQQQQQQQRITQNISPIRQQQQQRYTRSTQYHYRQAVPMNPASAAAVTQQPRGRLFTTDEHMACAPIQISTSPQAGEGAGLRGSIQSLAQSQYQQSQQQSQQQQQQQQQLRHSGTQFVLDGPAQKLIQQQALVNSIYGKFNALSREFLRTKERYVPQEYTPAEPVDEKEKKGAPAWFPRKPLSVLSSPRVVGRMPEETLMFMFYLSGNAQQQKMAACALGRLKWRFHTGKRLWLLGKGEPSERSGDCEVGDYYYYDWEEGALERKVLSGFKFEYKFFDKC